MPCAAMMAGTSFFCCSFPLMGVVVVTAPKGVVPERCTPVFM
jgi:hypothetical protein